MSGRYGLVRVRIVFDDERADRGEDFVVYQVYDPSANQWVEVPKEVAEDIAERGRSVAGGFTRNGMHFVFAVHRHRLGPYERYVIEWIDELPKRRLLINEGVKIVYRSSDDKGDYFEVVPL